MLNKIHQILKDPECTGNIKAFAWAFGMTIFYICVLIYGFAWFDYTAAETNFSNRLKKAEGQIKLNRVGIKHKTTQLIYRINNLENNIMQSCFKGQATK